MSFYDALGGTPTPRPQPQYDPGLGGYSYRDVYAAGQPDLPFASKVQARIKAMADLTQAQRIAQSNPAAEANRLVQQEKGQKRKGLGRLLGIPELPGVRNALGAVAALGQANLVGGAAGRRALHGETLVIKDPYGNTRTLKPGQSLKEATGEALYTGDQSADIRAQGGSVNPLRYATQVGGGYAGGLTGHQHTTFNEALGGKILGAKLPETGGGRIASEIIGGTLTDPLSWLGAGRAATAFKTTKAAAKAAGGAELASRLGQTGFKGLEDAERVKILAQMEENARLAPTRFARGTAAERAAKTAERAAKFGKEGLHVNLPFVPGASGQFSLGGTRFAAEAGKIDQATGIGSKLSSVANTSKAVKLRGIANPRAQIAAEKGQQYASDVRDAERRAASLRIGLSGDAAGVTRKIMQRGNFTPEEIQYVRRALDEGTDHVQMANAARPEVKDLIHHLHDTVRRGDQMLLDMGVNPEHLMSPGNYVPRQLTKQGREALKALDNDKLQRLFGVGANEVQTLRQEIERGTIVKRRIFKGPLDQAERQIGAITGAKVKHFEDDPVKAILGHYGNIAGAYSQRQMLREMAKGGLIEKAGKGSAIDAGALTGSYSGPQTLADYLNRRAKPLYQDPSQEALKGIGGKAQSAWKAGALNWPGTAARDIFGNAWRQMIEGVGSRQFREARRTHKGIEWAIEHPAETTGAWIDPERRALEAGSRPFGELLARNPTPPELPPSRFPQLLQTNPPHIPPGAPVNQLPTSGVLRPMPGGPPLRALNPGRGPVLPTPEARLRELAARPPKPGAKVHEPEKLRRFFGTMEPGTPNSIQEVPVPSYWTGEAARSRPSERMGVQFDNEGRPVSSISSLFENADAQRPYDTQAWTHPDYAGQQLASGPGGLWETMVRAGLPITDRGEGGLSGAGASAAAGFRQRLGRGAAAFPNVPPGMATGEAVAAAKQLYPDFGPESLRRAVEMDITGKATAKLDKMVEQAIRSGDLLIPPGEFDEAGRYIATPSSGLPIPMGEHGPPPLALPRGPLAPLAAPHGPATQPQLITPGGGRLHGLRAQPPIQGPPGPAEILAGTSKPPFAMGSGVQSGQLDLGLDALKGHGPGYRPSGPLALPAGPRPPLALPAGPTPPAGSQRAVGPFAMGPPPPRALEQTTGGTPLARWRAGEGYTRPMTGAPGAVPSGPGFAVPPGGPAGPLDPGALDALKGLPGAPRVGESRVTQRLRQIASGGFQGAPLSPEEARFTMLARQEGAMLPGFTASMGGRGGTARTRAGRAFERRNTLLRDALNVEPFEEKARLSLFHKLIGEGMDPNSAAGAVEDAFFNYADVSQSVQGARKVAPFIGFRVKNIQRTLRDLGGAPGRVTYPARVETAAMTEQDATDQARGTLIQQLVQNGATPEEANLQAEKKFGKPGLASVMAQGGVPIPGTDAYFKPSITSDEALNDLYLAPRIAAVLGGAKADQNLAGDLLTQAGGPIPGFAKALAEENAGQYMYSGGKIKPGFFNNPFVQNLAPQPGRLNQLMGPKPLSAKLSSAIGGVPTYSGANPRNLQAEVYRREQGSAANQVLNDLVGELRKAENSGLDDKAAQIRAVMDWVKANPEYVDTSVGAASKNPANVNPLQAMRAMRGKSMIEKILASTRAQYAAPTR